MTFFKSALFLLLLAASFASNYSLPVCTDGTFGAAPGSAGENPDYIIIGGGAAGSVAISQCIAKGHKCTLIDRGIDYYEQPFVTLPSATSPVYSSSATKIAVSAPLTNMYNKTMYIFEPNVLGGSTSINAMISVFTDIENYYGEIDVEGWSYEELLPYYLETTKSIHRPEYDGQVDVTDTSVDDPQYVAFKSAVQQVFPNIHEKLPDMNTASVTSGFPGFGPPETTVKTTYSNYGGVNVPTTGFRESGYVAFVDPIRQHPNLKVMTRSRVDKIGFNVFKNSAKKVFVTYTNYFGQELQCELSAKRAIVLSAGALRTPQILLQSGVGPADELTSLGIPVVKNLPNVGRNLDDHPTIVRSYLGSLPDSYISANINGHAYWNYQDDPSLIPNWSVQISGLPGFPIKNVLNVLMNQTSRGYVRLSSTDPAEQPIFNLDYFRDLEDIVPASLGFAKTNQIAQNLGYIELPDASIVVCPDFLPNCQNNATEFYVASFLQYGYSGFHFTGTCAFDKVVCPNNGRVFGFTNLYVVDASVFPKAPRGNTQISVYAASRKLSESIF
ncbi:GMC-type oxidoreductase [Megavirus chiliensis]|uniref:GMC-type oxidoreductase n=2 Tax=Megamimivirinae TaxID=3044648 RepID=A0A2L2DNG6_MIMIV|nr:putative GMC-type oxidoreductase [Megavirus chiliensis]AEQ33456.1 GMC-type oxidoreductase [Megavirus chiliensis]AVG47708.1 GMC-type oxidoreductase [Acanthamoeba polyphaga mimivirus]